jgi:uncharacterized membrane protein
MNKNSAYLYLVLSSLFIILEASITMQYGVLFPAILATSIISVIAFVSQFIFFSIGSNSKKFSSGKIQALLTLLIFATTAIQLATVFGNGYFVTNTYNLIETYLATIVMSIAAIPSLVLGSLIVRKYKGKFRLIGFGLIIFAIIVVFVFYFGGTFYKVVINDAEYLAFRSAQDLLQGKNPYVQNYTSGLYQSFLNNNVSSVTLTTSGSIVGTMTYPPLYFITTVPFYLISGTLSRFAVNGLLGEDAIYFLIMVASIAYFSGKLENKKILGLILILPFMVFDVISPAVMLIIAALVIAYFSMDEWYFGLLLGIAASIQQLAWLPVILLFAYKYHNSGFRKTLKDLAISLATFLAISAYFLLSAPIIYLKSLFLSVGGSFIPTGLGPIGLLLMKSFNIPLAYFPVIFYSTFLLGAIAFLKLNDKRMIGIFSLLPFFFLNYARSEYYVLFISLSIVLFAIDSNKPIKRKLGTEYLVLGACIALAIIALIAYGHIQYIHAVGISVTGASTTYTSNSLEYSARLSRQATVAGNFTAVLYFFHGNYTEPYIYDAVGIFSTKYPILVENNSTLQHDIIHFPNGPTEEFNFTIRAQSEADQYLQCAIYDKAYFYICPNANNR